MNDVNAIVWKYLANEATLTAVIGQRIYIQSLPENHTLPAVSFFVRGGQSTPYIPDVIEPSFQFDCWAENLMDAREVYGALYEVLQGIQNEDVTIAAGTFQIMGAREEVQGIDLREVEIPNYFRVLSFFEIMIRV